MSDRAADERSGEELDDPASGADLAQEADPDAAPELDGQLAYDCAGWAGETRGLLKSLLVTNEIPHVWQGTTLTVRESDEARVDELIDEVSGTARPALDPSEPKVVYEVGAWPASLQSLLAESLTHADLPYEWDEHGDLVVLEADEEAVSLVMEDLPDPDESTIASDDGVAVHELLDAVFMSTDRLARNGADAAGTVALADAAEVIERLALPFGFEPGEWRAFVARVTELRDALTGGPMIGGAVADDDVASAGDGGDGAEAERLDDDQIAELARSIHRQVRQYV